MLTNQLFLLFLVIVLGYLLGRIRIGGLGLGAAGILLVGLVFGHFGYETDDIVQNIGLVCFVTAVGFIAGPGFFAVFFGRAKFFVLIGVSIILSGVAACLLILHFSGISVPLALGLLTGALTSTPGLAAGIEATGSDFVSVGYGIAYPFGVVSVVLFVQLLPRFLKVDIEEEKRIWSSSTKTKERVLPDRLIKIDQFGFFSFALSIILGLLLARISIPLPNGGSFGLGTSGGPLLTGILMGYFQALWRIDLRVEKNTLVVIRELGLALFLAGAGMHAGKGFVQVLMDHGPILFVYGAIIAVVPMLVGILVARKLCKLNFLDCLGSICGGMTSTPALGALIAYTGTDDVTSSYAATYPIALALIVILVELIG